MRITLKWKKYGAWMWAGLIQDRNQWRALVNTAMKLRVLKEQFPDFMNDIYLSVCLSVYLQSFLDLGRFFSFLILYTVGRTPWTGDQTAARSIPTHRTTQTQNKHTQTSMTWAGFEPTNPALDRATTAIGLDERLLALKECFSPIPLFSYVLPKTSLRVRHILCRQLCGRTALSVQQIAGMEDFGSNRILEM
jgi:hypothetical protein